MKLFSKTALALLAFTSFTPIASAEGTIKIAILEPFSGPLAANGADILERFQFLFGRVNDAGGVLGGTKFEVIGLDTAWDVEKTAQQMQAAADQGVHYVINGIGPQHASAVSSFIAKWNKRSPGNEMAFLVHSATNNAISNEDCSFYQAVFDPTVEMKLNALVVGMKAAGFGTKVFSINPDFDFGQTVDATFKKLVAGGNTGLELVGSEMIAPFGQVQDFTPLIARIKESGADVVMTGNFGPDLIRLINAAADSGLTAKFATLYGEDPSTMAAVGAKNFLATNVINPIEYDENDTGGVAVLEELNKVYRDIAKTNWGTDRYRMMTESLVAAITKAGSAKPKDVMANIGGTKVVTAAGEGTIREQDHQMLIPYTIISVDPNAKHTVLYKGQDAGFGWKTVTKVDLAAMSLSSTCQMKDKP